MTKQGMAELVAYLEERGYVERVPDHTDRRAKIVRLTQKGWHVVEVGTKAIDEIEASWARRIGPERLRELRAMLTELVASDGHSN